MLNPKDEWISNNSRNIKKEEVKKPTDSKRSILTGTEIQRLEKEKVSLFFAHNT